MKIALALAFLIPAQASAQEVIRFVTCPIYRDTDAGRKSGCWLADAPASAIRYDVSASPTKPDWNSEILVEGKVAAKQDGACGGVVLDPVRVSILEDKCPRHMLPAEGFAGRKFGLPPRNVRPLSEKRQVPSPPYKARTFNLYFDFDQAFVIYQYTDFLLDQAATWLQEAKPKRIVVTGYAATDPMEVSGRTLRERPEVARERAARIGEALKRLGLGENLTLAWKTGAEPTADADADGLPDQSRRRVEIKAEF